MERRPTRGVKQDELAIDGDGGLPDREKEDRSSAPAQEGCQPFRSRPRESAGRGEDLDPHSSAKPINCTRSSARRSFTFGSHSSASSRSLSLA